MGGAALGKCHRESRRRCRLHGLLEGGEAGGGGVGSRKRKRLYARPRLELDFCGRHEGARVTCRPRRLGQHARRSASRGRPVWCSRTGGAGRGEQHWSAGRQLLDGGKRVFAKTTFVLESLANLGPQSCGDTRRGRTRHPSKAVSQSVSRRRSRLQVLVSCAPRQQCRVW